VLAAVYHGAGDVRVADVADPPDPGRAEVQLRVTRAAVCGTDASEFKHGPHLIPLHERHHGSGHVGPLILGHEFTGVVETAGPGVALPPGARVVPGAGMWCGACAWCRVGRTNLCASYYTLGLQAHGGLAERVNVPARMCVPVPDGCSDDAAAIAQPFAVALHALRRGGIARGTSVVLIGVGGIGLFLLAAAMTSGASPVVAVDIDPDRLESAAQLGAAHVLHATRDDVHAAVLELTCGAGAQIVVEASGAPPAPALAQSLVARGGRIVLLGLQAEPRALDLSDLTVREVDLVSTNAHVCDVDLPQAVQLLAGGRLAELAVDRVVPLRDVVEEGLVPLAEGTARGKIVIDTASLSA
jgi:(R,R)-butanediol dehydrogenase/meso-butanediol dehydrogenase/diacetyl reductase